MLRFLTFLYDVEDQEQGRAYVDTLNGIVGSSGYSWRCVHQSGGLSVWLAGDRAPTPEGGVNHDESGFVVGRLFASDGGDGGLRENGLIGRSIATSISRSQGRWLASRYWGSYVAFLRDPDNGRPIVIRDPTGAMPCFHIAHRGIRIFFSDIGDVRRSGLFSFSVNTDFLKANVLLPRLQKTITGLIGIEEVLPGEFWVQGRAGQSQVFIWNPYDFVHDRPVEDVEAAAALLRHTVEQTIWSLSGAFDRIVHHLGGLDSSIIYACLATAPSRPQLSLVNFVTSSPRGDERYYVREMAATHEAQLIELPLDGGRLDIGLMAAACDQVSPLGHFECVDVAADSYAREEVRNADARFFGVGGDNVLLQASELYPALDHVNAHGIGRGLFRVAANVMRDSRWSAYHVIKAIVRERFAPEPAFDNVRAHMFAGFGGMGFNPAFREEGPRLDLLHPLLLPPAGIPKGKCFQILLSCFCPIEYYDQFFRRHEVERVHVFLSQPIIETCLRIPSWILSLNGIERGLARLAFKDRLPDRVLRRLTKGTPEEIYTDFIRDNRRALREFLIDGLLVGYEILCPKSVELMLSDDAIDIDASSRSIIDFFNWEAWARQWTGALAP